MEISGLSANLDGIDLVNRVFGKDGCLADQIDTDEREPLRNLLAGLYGVFRNFYGHRDKEPEWYEADAILAMINWSLKEIERYRREIPSQA